VSEDFVLTKLEQMEAILAEIRNHLKKSLPTSTFVLPFEMQNINWINFTDKKNMPYRLATDQNNIGNSDFTKAKELLKSGGGTFRQKDGLSWLLFPDGDAIGVWDYKQKR